MSRQRRVVTNPFGDANDEPDDTFNNPFARSGGGGPGRGNGASTSAASSGGGAAVKTGIGGFARNNKSSSNTNPFGEDDEEEPPSLAVKRAPKKSGASNNPFGDDKPVKPLITTTAPTSGPTSTPTKAANTVNATPNKNLPKNTKITVTTNTAPSQPTASSSSTNNTSFHQRSKTMNSNPFDSTSNSSSSKPKPTPTKSSNPFDNDPNTSTKIISTNPFGNDTIVISSTPTKKTNTDKSHVRNKTAPVSNSNIFPVDPYENKSNNKSKSKKNTNVTPSKPPNNKDSSTNNNNTNPFTESFSDFKHSSENTIQTSSTGTPAKRSKPKKSFFGSSKKNSRNASNSGGGGLDPIVAKMDTESVVPPSTATATTTSSSSFNVNGSTTNGTEKEPQSSLANWLRLNKSADEQEFGDGGGDGTTPGNHVNPVPYNGNGTHTTPLKQSNQQYSNAPPSTINTKRKKKKTKKKINVVKCWPYDDYHKEEEKYYQYLKERETTMLQKRMSYSERNAASGAASPSTTTSTTTSPSKRSERTVAGGVGLFDSFGRNRNKQEEETPVEEQRSSIMDRPPALPSVKEAVQNLSLFEFEKKAEERAINIVSSWLFDAGLIDELLVNGGTTRRNLSAVNSNGGATGGTTTAAGGGGGLDVSGEGVEVGAHGFPLEGAIEGALKIDKEVEKLRATSQRELTLINTRLNDGVAASGSEVQELVNAVSATKDKLGRLRELSTYISVGYKNDDVNGDVRGANGGEVGFNLTKYPRLKRAINARRNIFRCFRELEFFSQIPLTCDRLREELHQGEWTENEWSTIRNVCMEHVELEILLVEAEAGMKAWLNEDETSMNDDDSVMSSTRSVNIRNWKSKKNMMGNQEMVDEFLVQHVNNVWELGNEINVRILAGIGSAFKLAMENPVGMVALVEAVEVYERAAEQYKAAHEDETESSQNRLHFTDMRAAALAKLYEDFELRGLEVFRAIHMQAADLADEDNAFQAQFSSVLRGCTELVTEIDVVKNQMAPCFAPHWHVEMLWSSCVAHVCSNQIIQQIGGPDGQNLPDLTVTQLLDLVAWVEFFRETIEEAFPSIASKHAKKAYFDERPDLFAGNNKAVNMENATDSLAWVNNMLWEVHRLAQEEFLVRTRGQTDEWLNNVYNAEHEMKETKEGRLMTSLCEDIFSLAGLQLRTIQERLSQKSDALVMAVCLIFSQLRSKQIHSRDKFLFDLETCCAAANDFQRMGERVEDVLQQLVDSCDLQEDSITMLEESCSALVSMYSGDAVFAAQKVHLYVFEPIWDALSGEFFSSEWENELTNNENAINVTRTLDDFMEDLEVFLDEFMLKKCVDALVTSFAIFYLKCLMLKAENHNSNRNGYFGSNELSLERMDRDIKVVRDYFDGLAEGMPALAKVVEREFEILTTVQELMRIASGNHDSDASDFILVLHKKIKDVNITRHIVGDLWHLMMPTEENTILETMDTMEDSLNAVSPPEETSFTQDRMDVPGLRFDESLAKLFIESKRKRPGPGVVESLKKRWSGTAE